MKAAHLESINYVRIISGPHGKKREDVELWVNCSIPWGRIRVKEVKPRAWDFTVAFTKQRCLYVTMRSQFLRADFLVVHAPHSWAAKERHGPRRGFLEGRRCRHCSASQ